MGATSVAGGGGGGCGAGSSGNFRGDAELAGKGGVVGGIRAEVEVNISAPDRAFSIAGEGTAAVSSGRGDTGDRDD